MSLFIAMVTWAGVFLSGIAVARHTGSVLDGFAVSCALYALIPYGGQSQVRGRS